MPDAQIRSELSLNYRLSGPESAEVLLLITGLGGLQEGWFRQIPYFESRFRVLTFDNRGAGRSGVVDRPTSLREMAEDAVLLMDTLGIEAAHVWGVSMGGKIAQELALNWPNRVRRLILGCTTAGEEHRVEGPVKPLLRGSVGATEEEWLNTLVPRLFGREYREKNANSMRAFAKSRVRHPQDPIGFARQWEAYEAFDSFDRLPRISHRTLVITGDEDSMTDPMNADVLVAKLPNAEKFVVPSAGHSFHIEQPQIVNPVVERFLLDPSPTHSKAID